MLLSKEKEALHTNNWLCDLPAKKMRCIRKNILLIFFLSLWSIAADSVLLRRKKQKKKKTSKGRAHNKELLVHQCVIVCLSAEDPQKKKDHWSEEKGKRRDGTGQCWETWQKVLTKLDRSVSLTVLLKSGQSEWSGRLVETAIDFNFDLFLKIFFLKKPTTISRDKHDRTGLTEKTSFLISLQVNLFDLRR